MRAFPVVLAVALVTSACVSARSVAIGPAAAPRPSNCTLAYARIDPHEAMTTWRQVGSVCVTIPYSRSPRVDDLYAPGSARDALTKEACNLGAQMVTPMSMCGDRRSRGVEFGAFVARAGQGAGEVTAAPAGGS